jgi:phosphatidylglycerophosphatase A
MGSLGSLVIWVPSVYFLWPTYVKLAVLVGIFGIGVWASKHAIAFYHDSDPPQVVIDEVVGQGIPFLIISFNIVEILLAFLLFRIFDIWKPWPIKILERSFSDPWGVMIDDVAAGIYAALVIVAGKLLLTSQLDVAIP